MNKEIIYDLTPPLVFLLLVVAFLGGLFYLIRADQAQIERQYNTCIAAGNQYLNGDCIK